MKVFIQSIVAQLLLNPYIFWRGYQALPPKKSCRIPFILFFVLELSLYFFGFIFRNELPDNVIITIQYICNTWYIASIYITLSLLVLELIRLSQRIKPWFPKWMKGHWQQTKVTLFFLIVFGVTGLMIHAYHTVMNPIVKNVYITLPKAGGGSDSLDYCHDERLTYRRGYREGLGTKICGAQQRTASGYGGISGGYHGL